MMSWLRSVFVVLFLFTMFSQVHANIVVNMQLVANGSSRWSEHFSDAYGQLDLDPDGFYLISSPGTRVGNAVVIFPNEAMFSPNYRLTYDSTGITNVGSEVANITSVTTGFRFDIADDDSRVGGYSESNGTVVGTVQLFDGVVTGANFTSAVTFTYDGAPFGLGLLPYNGTFNVSGNAWSLLVDETQNTFLGPVRYSWEATGTAGFSAVPEPTSAILAGLSMAGVFLIRRRRGAAPSVSS